MADMAGSPSRNDPKYAPGAEQMRQDIGVGISIAMTLLGVLCVGLRVYTRAYIVRNMGIEDWTMIGAAVLTIVFLLEVIAGSKHYMMGFGGLSLTPELMKSNIKMILAIIVTYKTTVTVIKISIVMMYLRLAVDRTFARLCKGTIYLLLLWQFILFIVVPAQCRPLNKLWDFTGRIQGKCINANAFYLTTSIFHILVDLWILVLPVKLFRSIKRPTREKLVLLLVFSLGAFSTIASIVRLQFLRAFTVSDDPFYASLPINTWSMVEVNVGILCASLSTLRPLFSKAQRYRTWEALGERVRSRSASATSARKGFGNKSGSGSPQATKEQDIVFERLITLTAVTVRDPKEWFEEVERPPAVPPKDERFETASFKSGKSGHSEMLSPGLTVPPLVVRKI
ncbi:hypothetical protein BDV95DRAFT_600138 [Massariosphaeria phaeospora]|uniref:Rhodopsin domain-containing protein n=1 Tax=Massariosphaeria phaeospora TaxID=100035 RepID=A0A7C8I2B1_9PLEO|nr:hypothetical protein BDV95DRAFT_600138 [Massariosphaeria phaeospora]